MLNAVSSGSRLTNVTPVRSGGSSSKSRGSLARPQLASVTPAEKRKVRHGRSIGGSVRALSADSTPARGGVSGHRTMFGALPLPRRPDPDRLAATGSEHEMQPRRRVHRAPRD